MTKRDSTRSVTNRSSMSSSSRSSGGVLASTISSRARTSPQPASRSQQIPSSTSTSATSSMNGSNTTNPLRRAREERSLFSRRTEISDNTNNNTNTDLFGARRPPRDLSPDSPDRVHEDISSDADGDSNTNDLQRPDPLLQQDQQQNNQPQPPAFNQNQVMEAIARLQARVDETEQQHNDALQTIADLRQQNRTLLQQLNNAVAHQSDVDSSSSEEPAPILCGPRTGKSTCPTST